MKGKPNLEGFSKDPSAFLAGGAAAATEKPAELPPLATGPKITKTIRMSVAMDQRLKEEAHRRSMADGKRVTESDLIELALFKYLNK